jgi:hypothetical protein
MRQQLGVLELVSSHLVAAVVENHEAGARRALVDRGNEISHWTNPPFQPDADTP